MAGIGVVGAETVLAGVVGAGVACRSGRFPRTCGLEKRERHPMRAGCSATETTDGSKKSWRRRGGERRGRAVRSSLS